MPTSRFPVSVGEKEELGRKNKAMRVILAYKNFSAVSHIGLGVSAMNTCKVLEKHGVHTEVWPVSTAQDLINKLSEEAHSHHPITHVVMAAPWMAASDWAKILIKFHRIWFAVNCHSNVGFLQADANGVANMEQCLQLEMGYPNFRFSGNSRAFCKWIQDAYGNPCQYLPNLYYLTDKTPRHRPVFHAGPGGGGTLRIGCFGAVRPLKNTMSAAAAAIEIAARLRCDLEFWISGGRFEGGGNVVVNALVQMFKPIKFAELMTSPWESWPSFKKTVSNMHLLIQPSYTESFNMVTADGISQGVASVVSPAIEWVPDYWKADSDDVFDIARAGRNLLFDDHAASDGLEYLETYVGAGLHAWNKYFEMKKV